MGSIHQTTRWMYGGGGTVEMVYAQLALFIRGY